MLAMTTDVQRAPEPVRAPPQPRAYTRRIDCCEGRARPESSAFTRGGAPAQDESWEHTRRTRT